LATNRTLLLIGLTDERHPEVIARAAQLAAAMRLRIFAYFPVRDGTRLAAVVPGTWRAAQDARETAFERAYDELQNTLETLATHGHEADGRVEWRRSPISGALNMVREHAPRLVLLAPKPHDAVTDLVVSGEDFELIRRCQAPVWLARQFPADCTTILAAVDPTHGGDRALEVDHAVLSESRSLAQSLGKNLRVLHAFLAPSRLGGVIEATAHETIDRSTERAYAYHYERLRMLTQVHGIRASDLLVREGDLQAVLQEVVDPLDVDVVVIGALSRSRAQRMLIGGTAEILLRSLDRDLVVVKA
jgi:universal stress protein E